MSRFVCGVLLSAFASVTLGQGSLEAENIEALLKLAGNGEHAAQHALCYRFLYGEGVEKNLPNAVHWCQIAAESSDSNSQTLLAEIYYKGEAVPVDYKKALALFQAAAEQDHRHAQYMLSKMYFFGQGTAPDSTIGLKWLKRAAAQGYEPAIETLRKFENASHSGA